MSEEAINFPQRNAAGAGRTLPHSIEAEEYFLSCCLLDGADILVRAQAAGVMPESLYVSAHGMVYTVMLDLHAAQKPIDVSVVAEELKVRRDRPEDVTWLERIGGYAFLTQISSRIPTTAQAGYFIDKVRQQAMLREIIRRATSMVEDVYRFDGSENFFDERIVPQIERLNGLLIGQREARSWPQAVKEAELATRERIKPPEQRKQAEIELSWGIPDFDRFFMPIELGELVVIGGYTSSGKSSLLRNVLWNFAKAARPVLMETIETRDVEEAINFAAHISGIRSRGRLHELHGKDAEKLLASFAAMQLPHFSVCHEDHSVRSIFGRALMFKRRHKLRALGIDYLQLLEDVQRARNSGERAIALGNVTSACKQFATREELAVLLLSGFNREYVRDGNREPRLSDLEGGSAIEKDASRVLLLHIPTEYVLNGVKYTQSTTADSEEQPRLFVKVIQAKGRNTGTSSVGMFFKRETKTFEQITKFQPGTLPIQGDEPEELIERQAREGR